MTKMFAEMPTEIKEMSQDELSQIFMRRLFVSTLLSPSPSLKKGEKNRELIA